MPRTATNPEAVAIDDMKHYTLPTSQRGTYDRRKHRRESSPPPIIGSTGSSSNHRQEGLLSAAGSNILATNIAVAVHEPGNTASHSTSRSHVESDSPIQALTGCEPNATYQAVCSVMTTNPRSLASMFEDLLEREHHEDVSGGAPRASHAAVAPSGTCRSAV